MTVTVGSVFTGIGGIDLGFEQAGLDIAWQCEKDPACRQVLASHWPDVPCYDDVETLTGDRLATVDVLCGGFPCQDISVAGRRAGLAGNRSGLFHQFARLAAQIRPRWLVIENVPGLLSSNNGRDMGTVVGVLADIGYGWAYRVLDAQHFGVAQRRRRLFIVGHLGNPAAACQILFEPESCDRHSAPSREAGAAVAALTGNGVGTCGADDNQGQAGHLIPAVAPCEAGRYGKGVDSDCDDALVAFHQTQDPITDNLVAPRLGATSIGMGVAYQCHGSNVGPMGTLRAGNGNQGGGVPFIPADMQVRRLTPVECERLQGFPDDWTAGQADSARYRMLGNAVAVPCARWIGARIAQLAAA